jgi:hypothetical protein
MMPARAAALVLLCAAACTPPVRVKRVPADELYREDSAFETDVLA